MRRNERLIRSERPSKFNKLQESSGPDKRSTAGNFPVAIGPASFLIASRLLHWIDNQHSEITVVRRLTSSRLEFEAAAIYEYPEHLRSFLSELPTRPGVYLFHGESDTMPLYIGKSVNIRSRVLSHLRTPDEAAMLRQSRRISWICTAGEIGALLLEARLIKEQQPLFNKRLRRNRQLCSLKLDNQRTEVVYAKEVD